MWRELLLIRTKSSVDVLQTKTRDFHSRLLHNILAPACCTTPHLNRDWCVVVNLSEQRISSCVVYMWKANCRERSDTIVRTLSFRKRLESYVKSRCFHSSKWAWKSNVWVRWRWGAYKCDSMSLGHVSIPNFGFWNWVGRDPIPLTLPLNRTCFMNHSTCWLISLAYEGGVSHEYSLNSTLLPCRKRGDVNTFNHFHLLNSGQFRLQGFILIYCTVIPKSVLKYVFDFIFHGFDLQLIWKNQSSIFALRQAAIESHIFHRAVEANLSHSFYGHCTNFRLAAIFQGRRRMCRLCASTRSVMWRRCLKDPTRSTGRPLRGGGATPVLSLSHGPER